MSMRLLQPFIDLLPQYPDYPTDRLDILRQLDLDERIPVALAYELLELAVRDTGDIDVGLKAGRRVELGDHGALDFAMHSAATQYEAVGIASRYMRLLSDAIEVRLEIDGDLAIVRLDSRVPVPRAAIDFQASCLHSSRTRSSPRWVDDLEWWFPHPRPADTREYERTFKTARVRFSAPCFGYAFPRELLYARMPDAHPKLNSVLRGHIEMLLAELPQTSNITETVRELIMEDLAVGTPNLAQVARRLQLGRRTLARRLESEGVTFSTLLEDTRRRVGLRYVARTQLQFSEITLLLGFSEVATFYRAFRRWTQQTPLAY
ncbi:MAG TPA: AraC family transcriptional regulator ligand-binding domain-containing protein, partial [Polyangiales bacterium]|nr:AraC family transcriptional regulator ligand-binding domain-containing protein [Polyangiales bacterium]